VDVGGTEKLSLLKRMGWINNMKKLTKEEQRAEAWEVCNAITELAWKAYLATQDLAYEAYSVKLREIYKESK